VAQIEGLSMARETKGISFLILPIRGLLGAAIGALVLFAILLLFAKFGSWDIWAGWLVVVYLVFGLPLGAFIGGLVGAAIILINKQIGTDMGSLFRMAVGTAIAIIFWAIFFLEKETSEYRDTNSWLWFVLTVILFATFTGGVAGLAVGRQGSGVKAPEDE
jgi:uncharacterized membrane protein YgaE (UPF0421/DUF939 family)